HPLFPYTTLFRSEKLLADARGYDPLEVGHSLGLDPLSLGLLLLLLQYELHLLGLLLAPELLLDRVGHDRRQADLAQQHRLGDDAAALRHLPEELQGLVGDLVAFR